MHAPHPRQSLRGRMSPLAVLLASAALQGACGESTPGPGQGSPTGNGTTSSSSGTTGGSGDSCECSGSGCQAPDACHSMGCPEGQMCSASGSCELIGVLDPDLGGAGAASEPEECLEVEVAYQTVIPTVSLLIDRSSSMTGETGNYSLDVLQEIDAGTYHPWGCPADPAAPADDPDQLNYDWRWNVVRNVLFRPESGVVPAFQGEVRFGITLFTHQPDV